MTDPVALLKTVETILVVDWPSRDVPETLARAGFEVFVHGGPNPDDYSVYEVRGDEVVARRTGVRPEHADLVYSHRPLDEITWTIETARAVGATVVWTQSGVGSDGQPDPHGCWVDPEAAGRVRDTVEAAGLGYVDAEYIADVARRGITHAG
jgi:predicted CoA-binding protein